MQAPGSFGRRLGRAKADTRWFSWKTDIIPSAVAGIATFGATYVVTRGDEDFSMSQVLIPIVAGVVAVTGWFLAANLLEFAWKFTTAGLRNQIGDIQAAKRAEQVSFDVELADRTPLRDGEPSELAVRVLVIGSARAENCRLRVVKVDGGGYVPPGLDGDVDIPLGWDNPDVPGASAVKSFHGSAVARLCRTVRGSPNFVVIESVGDYTPPNLSTEREYVLDVEITADNGPRTVAQVKVRAYRFLTYPKKGAEDVEVVIRLGQAKWDRGVIAIEPAPDTGGSPN